MGKYREKRYIYFEDGHQVSRGNTCPPPCIKGRTNPEVRLFIRTLDWNVSMTE